MARLIELNLRPDRGSLRQFGFIACAVCSVLALCAFGELGLFRFGLGAARLPLTGALLALGLLSALFSLVRPGANRALYLLLSVAFFPVGFVVSYLLTGLLFFLVIGPFAIAMRIAGRDPLARRYDKDAASYFRTRARRRDKASYFRQF